MLEKLCDFSVRNRGLVLIATLLLAAVGVWQMLRLPIDAVPDVTNVQVTVLTSSPGLSPLEVEQYITFPIERTMNGLPNLRQIRSVSRTGVSSVTIVFEDTVDVWFARQLVNERLPEAAAAIPAGYGRPELGPVATALGDIFEFILSSDRHTPMELRTYLDWVIGPRLRQVPGVIEVNSLGGEAKQYQVLVDPKKLAGLDLTFHQVIEALERNNAAVGGGYFEKSGESIVIRGDGLVGGLDELKRVRLGVDPSGTPIFLEKVAAVEIGPALRFGAATQHGRGPVVTGTVMMLIGSNSRDVVRRVKERIAEIEPDLPEGMKIEAFNDRADFIDRVLGTIFTNLSEGALFVTVVLFVALGSIKGALVTALAIPIAMLVAIIGMRQLGVVGNVMSLGAIDFGLLVDGCIVVIEAVAVQVAQSHPTKAQLPTEIAAASRRVVRPVAFSLLIILLVYLPLMTLEGVEGKMFQPMAVTIALAMGGALLYTMTAFPAALAFFMRPNNFAHKEGRIYGFLLRTYGWLLDVSLRYASVPVVVAIVLLVGAGWAASRKGADFVPRLFEGKFVVDIRRLPSVSITEAERLGTRVEQTLARFPEVDNVVTRTGRAEVPTDPVGPDSAEVLVSLKSREEWTTATDPQALAAVMKDAIVAEVPATFPAMSQPIENRVNELLAGSRADVVVKIFGDNLETLKSVADRVGAVVKDVPGTGDLRVQRMLGLPLLEVKIDRQKLARTGIHVEEVLDSVEAVRVGKTVGTIFEGSQRFPLVVKLPPGEESEEGLASVVVGNGEGALVPLGQVAQIARRDSPAVITREALQRRVLVEVNVRGRDLVSWVNAARARVARDVELPKGYTIEWGGQFENFARAATRLSIVFPLCLAIIFGMLFVTFGNIAYATAVMTGVPFAAIGGILSLTLRGLPFSIPAGVGFIALCGIAVANGVVMAAEVQRLKQTLPFDEAIRRAALSRMRAVLTTAAVVCLGFLPMAISVLPGSEVQRPLATVVIGGMLTSTGLTLLLLPIIIRRLCRGSAQEVLPQSGDPAAAAA